ncbi:hypothetical protein ACT7DZ_14220 [Bacillus cereus]
MDIRTLQKYIHLPKHQLSTLFMTKFERERFENIQRKKADNQTGEKNFIPKE